MFDIQMPTFILFKNGEKVKELVGANPAGLQVCILPPCRSGAAGCEAGADMDMKFVQNLIQSAV